MYNILGKAAGRTVSESPMYTLDGVNGIRDDCDGLPGKVEEKRDPGVQRPKRLPESQSKEYSHG